MEPEAANASLQTEVAKPRNFFSRLGGVYTSPGETFREIGRSPQVLIPIIALVIIGLLGGYYLSQKIDLGAMQAEQLERMVANGTITQEQMQQQMNMVSKLGGIQLIIGSPISSLLMVLIIAAIFKLISSIVGAENRFKALFTVTVYTMIAVSIVQSLLLVVVLSFKSPADLAGTDIRTIIASNLGALASSLLGDDALPKYLMRLLGWVDVFAIWIIALLSIGYSAVSRKLKTSTAATWLGCLYGIVALIGAALAGMLSR